MMAMPLSEISALSDLYYDEAESGAFSMGPSQIERSRRGNGVSFGPEGSAWARDDTLHSGSSASFLGGYGRGTETQIDETRADASPTSGVDPRWVTVFGFPRSRTTEILHFFRKYGELLDHRPSSGNWVHICYATKLQAQQALAKNGKVINGDLMIGVVSCTEENVRTRPLAAPNSLRSATPAIASLSSKQSTVLLPSAVPQASSGFWSSFLSHVFGF